LRRTISAVGALLIIAAVFLYLNPSLNIPLSANLGQVGTETVFDRNVVVPIAPQGYSNYSVNLLTGDTLSVSLTTNPGNIDVLLMNQGNFSLWSSSTRGAYSTYPESHLQVSNYSFTFTSSEKPQDFYLVLVSHSTAPTEVLLQATGTRPSQEALLLFPLIFGLVGIVVLAVGLRGGGKKGAEQTQAAPTSQSRPTPATQTQPQSLFCRHCGAALKAGSQFCPACNKSQL